MTEIDALVEKVEQALCPKGWHGDRVKADQALTELAERAKAAERELEATLVAEEFEDRRAEAAEARVRELEQILEQAYIAYQAATQTRPEHL